MESFSKTRDFLNRYWTPIFCAMAALTALAFSLYAGNIWEDAFIVLRYCRNLAAGEGFVFEAGRRVQGFSSPLGLLSLAFCWFFAGSWGALTVIWVYRLLFAIPAFVAAGYFLIKSCRDKDDKPSCELFFLGIFYILEAKSLMFAMSGMETPFMLFFLAWAFYLIRRDLAGNYFLVGVAWAGLMWTRPDSCVYVTALALTALVFNVSPRKATLIGIGKAALVTTVLYLPWFLWTWWYFGSPIPHTITAKGAALINFQLGKTFLNIFLGLFSRAALIFSPPYYGAGWPVSINWFSWPVGLICLFYWLLPKLNDRIGKTASLLFFVLLLYQSVIPVPYPWYYPPITMLGLLVLVRAINQFGSLMNRKTNKKLWPTAISTGVAILMIIFFAMISIYSHVQQEIIENSTRIPAGQWLKQNASANDLIFLECLGYVGYFSEGKVRDYPGLVSPESVKLMKEGGCDFFSLPAALEPEWLVIRYYEYFRFREEAYFKRDYKLVKIFDSLPLFNNYSYIPGEKSLHSDACFLVFRKKMGGEKFKSVKSSEIPEYLSF